MDIEFPTMTPAPEEKSAKKRKLYLLRLHDQGLRSERVVRKTAKPDQFQIAQLSAAIGNRPGQKKLPFELASQAMRANEGRRSLWIPPGEWEARAALASAAHESKLYHP